MWFEREAEVAFPVPANATLNVVPLLLNPIASPIGPVHTTNGKKLTRLGKTSLESVLVETKELISYTADLDISADGHAGLTTGACDLARVNPIPPTPDLSQIPPGVWLLVLQSMLNPLIFLPFRPRPIHSKN